MYVYIFFIYLHIYSKAVYHYVVKHFEEHSLYESYRHDNDVNWYYYLIIKSLVIIKDGRICYYDII